MNAIKYIKDHGVEKAREVVKGAPEHCFVYDLERKEYVAYEDTSIAMCFLKSRFIDLSELKRLVESVNLVSNLGGIEKCKGYVQVCFFKNRDKYGNRIKQAIADYEQLFGNTETLELETLRDCDTSPNCKKFDERVGNNETN